jgi:hypothetical protein
MRCSRCANEQQDIGKVRFAQLSQAGSPFATGTFWLRGEPFRQDLLTALHVTHSSCKAAPDVLTPGAFIGPQIGTGRNGGLAGHFHLKTLQLWQRIAFEKHSRSLLRRSSKRHLSHQLQTQ